MRRLALPVLLAVLVSIAMPPIRATAAPDSAQGEKLARRWCAACHVVAVDQKQASADAPSFADIARRKSDGELTSFLTDPHPKMPDMSLSRSEIADLTAYMRSLAAPDGK